MNGNKSRGADRENRSALTRPAAATFGLGSTAKLRDVHVNRLALVYVRQSSPQQVLENRESRERQYALAEFAQRLGWPAERVVVVDEDQGQSGKTAPERLGFQRLMTEVSLNHVGVVLGLELSRLSRSNKDWHQLIDVCGIFNTLLCDQDGVYDPLDSNDRLLLGMRGAMSEYELVTLRNRLLRGSRNKAERGELFSHVPVGYLKLSSEEVVQEPDEQARDMVQLVFDKFEELGSGCAVFRYFVANHLQLGYRLQGAGRSSELEWRPPPVNRILKMLRHPMYAGAYAYPMHRPATKNPATGRTEGGKWFVPPEELPVLLRDRLPAYISWERYLANQERLNQNRAHADAPGTPKCGTALLQGLVVCGKCSFRMLTRHKGPQRPNYYYHRFWQADVLEDCGRINAAVLDDLVVKELLRALEPASLELSLRAIENVEQERQRLHNHWRQKLERVQHEVSRAERQYHAVEPDNRLVARTLEARWEAALKKQRQLEEEYHRFMAKLPTTLSATDRERIQALAQNVPSLWNAAETTAADRKRIVRCLVERVVVVVDRASEGNDVTIVWKGGLTTQHRLARPVNRFEHLKDYQRLIERVQELHRAGLHRGAIAAQLNAEGLAPPRRLGVFTESGVGNLMAKLGLVGELFRGDLLHKQERWIPDLARALGVIPQTIHYWIKQGWIHSRRTPSGKHLMVWADKDEMRRLKQLARAEPIRIRARHPNLIIPKRRTAR
jgi:DNA invertase Pin-like site-specific DNA recombinase/transposase-like protein